jgi:hypothetical protein
LRGELTGGGHGLVEHVELMQQLRVAAESGAKEERVRALQAQRYAKRRLEGLVKWNFSLTGIDRKDLISWAFRNIQKYFRRI